MSKRALFFCAMTFFWNACARQELPVAFSPDDTFSSNSKNRQTVDIYPQIDFGGGLLEGGPDDCTYTIAVDDKCVASGAVGFYGASVTYKGKIGQSVRIYGYCSYSGGVPVPMESSFTVGDPFPTLSTDWIAPDEMRVGLFYQPMVSREMPAELWPAVTPCSH